MTARADRETHMADDHAVVLRGIWLGLHEGDGPVTPFDRASLVISRHRHLLSLVGPPKSAPFKAAPESSRRHPHAARSLQPAEPVAFQPRLHHLQRIRGDRLL